MNPRRRRVSRDDARIVSRDDDDVSVSLALLRLLASAPRLSLPRRPAVRLVGRLVGPAGEQRVRVPREFPQERPESPKAAPPRPNAFARVRRARVRSAAPVQRRRRAPPGGGERRLLPPRPELARASAPRGARARGTPREPSEGSRSVGAAGGEPPSAARASGYEYSESESKSFTTPFVTSSYTSRSSSSSSSSSSSNPRSSATAAIKSPSDDDFSDASSIASRSPSDALRAPGSLPAAPPRTPPPRLLSRCRATAAPSPTAAPRVQFLPRASVRFGMTPGTPETFARRKPMPSAASGSRLASRAPAPPPARRRRTLPVRTSPPPPSPGAAAPPPPARARRASR